ncbi:MAG TPA: hypothetical protein DCL66_07395 [Gammaproteobacteria bacterium]|nr:hypothetical protein [Gammaproteobacteria bacterium]
MINSKQLQTLNSIKIPLGLGGLLSLLSFILFWDVLSANWRADDTQILAQALRYDVLDNFFNPEIWRQLSPANLTPWVVASFEIDLFLFGLSPIGFYTHQLVAIALVAIACFMLVRLWLDQRFAFAAALIFLLGLPTTAAANNLMTRHYVEGLLFACAAVYFCVGYLRGGQSKHLAVAAAFYLLSITAKEVFVPLVFLIPLLVQGPNRYRFKALVVFLIVSGVYTLWRGLMLEGLVGGYTAPSQFLSADYLMEAVGFIFSIPALLLGEYWQILAVFYVLALVLLCLKSKRAVIVILMVLALELLPLVPLANIPGISYPGRYYFLVWFTFCFSLAFCFKTAEDFLADKVPAKQANLVIFALFCFVVVYLQTSRQNFVGAIAARNAEFDVQAEFIWENGDDKYFVPSSGLLSGFWFVRGLREIKEFDRTGASVPNIVLDDMFLSSTTRPLYKFDSECNCMLDVSETLDERIRVQRGLVDPAGDLRIEISFQNNVFKWDFAPYIDNDYYIFSDYLGMVRFPNQGEFLFYDIDGPLEIRVGHFPSNGLKTFSDIMLIEQDAAPISWPN